jgi:hypothetical protein
MIGGSLQRLLMCLPRAIALIAIAPDRSSTAASICVSSHEEVQLLLARVT